jgi:hypothetical protein
MKYVDIIILTRYYLTCQLFSKTDKTNEEIMKRVIRKLIAYKFLFAKRVSRNTKQLAISFDGRVVQLHLPEA